MKKRLMGLLFVAMLALMLPAVAFGAEDVAEVNGQRYANVHEAIEAASAGDTVTLLCDVAMEKASADLPYGDFIEVTKDLTLDLGGHTLTGSDTWYAVQHTEGTLEVNLIPQGTMAECIRAGGAGLGGVLTPVGIDTLVEESPLCLGRQTVEGKDYLLMKPIHADFALLGTYECDEFGNCWYKGTMRNFNVVMATAADTVIAECEHLVPVGTIAPENIHTYGMCVDYIVEGESK